MLNIKINEENSFEFDESWMDGVDISPINEREFHLLVDGKSWNAEILSFDKESKEIQLKLNGKVFTAKVKDKMDQLLEKMGLSDLQSKKAPDLKAPMPGLVLDILTEPGSEVEKGDSLLILEAMKMENVLKASGPGVIKSIAVEKGAAVEKGQLLIAFE